MNKILKDITWEVYKNDDIILMDKNGSDTNHLFRKPSNKKR